MGIAIAATIIVFLVADWIIMSRRPAWAETWDLWCNATMTVLAAALMVMAIAKVDYLLTGMCGLIAGASAYRVAANLHRRRRRARQQDDQQPAEVQE